MMYIWQSIDHVYLTTWAKDLAKLRFESWMILAFVDLKGGYHFVM
jgi:hypothetical protein